MIMKTKIFLFGLLTIGFLGCQENAPEAEKQETGLVKLEMNPQEKMIHRRAVEAAVWAMPIEGTRGLLLAARSDLGADWNDIIYFSKPMESRHGFLTANNQVPYVVASLNTKDGPMVLEVCCIIFPISPSLIPIGFCAKEVIGVKSSRVIANFFIWCSFL